MSLLKAISLKTWIIAGLLFGLTAAGMVWRIVARYSADCTCPTCLAEPPAEVAALLPDWPPETVVASVEGNEITLEEVRRHRDGMLAGMLPEEGISDAALLELIVRRRLLAEAARSREIEETEAYRRTLADFRDAPAAKWMTKDDLRRRALAETLLAQEVIEQIDIRPEDIKDMYEIFGPTLPEGTTLEEARPMFENRLKRQAVERYVRKKIDQRRVTFHEAWLEHVEKQAKD